MYQFLYKYPYNKTDFQKYQQFCVSVRFPNDTSAYAEKTYHMVHIELVYIHICTYDPKRNHTLHCYEY
jgi:hypothetical protein